ncbi:hypothetical protein [Acinetobacter nematophilus]|uniref:Uncharacterized protein n=1 Tax=Acinetobacter nematophilus TaxID=2994642 RepID=A0A9X3DQE1_9GAMM|nr:hypothetical protein [Acinetobacter nematophilus]MCX5466158.1 hypothetical protein [Acinetobacter nematophilus]
MSYIYVITPLMQFYHYIQPELEKYKIEVLMEYFDANHQIQINAITAENLQTQLLKYGHRNLGFYFLDKAQKINKSQIYNDEYCIYAIEGKGGRETEDNLEKITLRMISKTPDKNIKGFFNAIKRKLNHDENFAQGIQGDSRLHQQHYYLKSYVGKKVFKSDFYNDKAPALIPK